MEQQKPYDLEKRTLEFAETVVLLCQKISADVVNREIIGQLVSSAGSVGANYREANEKLSKKDFLLRMKIARKEAKESTYWLELLRTANRSHEKECDALIKESVELRKILSSIIDKSTP